MNRLLPRRYSLRQLPLHISQRSAASGAGPARSDFVFEEPGFYSFGSASDGQLGIVLGGAAKVDPSAARLSHPRRVAISSVHDAKRSIVAAGDGFSVFAFQDGETELMRMFVCGDRRSGQCGMPNKDPSFTPLEMRNIPLLKDIVCGRFHALLLSGIVLRDVRFEKSNEVFGFGGGGNAQLARRMSVEETYLRRVGDRLRGVQTVKAGWFHGMAITEDHVLYTWGDAMQFQLGHGDMIMRWDPTPLPGLRNVTAVAGGLSHSVAILDQTKIIEFGSWSRGMPGKSAPVVNPTLTLEWSGSPIKNVECGSDHVTFLCEDGTLHSWGEGRNGELGNGQLERSSKPVQLKGIPSEVSSFSCHAQHSLAVADNRSGLYSWGQGQDDQLGLGKHRCNGREARKVGTCIDGLEIASVSAGWTHSLVAVQRVAAPKNASAC